MHDIQQTGYRNKLIDILCLRNDFHINIHPIINIIYWSDIFEFI